MKKIYFLTTALLLGANINAQIVVDFESFALPAAVDTFDNGSAGAGDFIINNVVLTNLYDTVWGSWNGFSISNMTDSVTAGWGNQYSSVNGYGASGSSNYAVFHPGGNITVSNSNLTFLSSFKITNTAYTAISMRDGDAFAKKFGDSLDANGVIDGTNGEDFLKVWILVEDASTLQKDSIEFFLADYRFADSTQDYILKTWETIDLNSFGFTVAKIDFRLESSDNGAWGMNTPAYFAIDDISYFIYVGIDELGANSINAYPNPVENVLTISGDKGEITLLDINGKVIQQFAHSGESKIDMTDLENGIYLLKLENATGVATQRIIK